MAQWFRYKKAIRKMGAAFAHNLPQTQSCENFEGVVGVVQPQYGLVFAPFCNRRRNMDSPQHIRDQAAVKRVRFFGRIGAENGLGVFVSQ